MKKRIKVSIVVVLLLIIISVLLHILLCLFSDEERLQRQTFQADGFTIRTLKLKEDDGRIRGLCAVYWKSRALTEKEIAKVLDANAEGSEWLEVNDDKHFKRWKLCEKLTEAAYRKKDYKLCLFSSDFAAWRKCKDFSKMDKQIYYDMIK